MSFIGEKCTECDTGVMSHPKLYYYECIVCGFAYEIDPNAGWGTDSIKIVRKPFERGKK